MAGKSKKQTKDMAEVLEEARLNFGEAYDRDRHNLLAEIEDLEFEAGKQWEDEILADRKGRPCLTINQTKQFVKLTTGDIRQLRPAMRAVPVDNRADIKTAEIIGDHFRYIENRSNARYAYTRAADRQVIAGMGHWRVGTDYADDTTFNQEILIQSIDGQVLWDPDAVSPTRDDAMFCFVYVDMNRAAFKRKYPDNASDGDFERAASDLNTSDDGSLGYGSDEHIRLAEYWVKKPIDRILLVQPDGGVDDLTDDDDAAEKIAQTEAMRAEAIALGMAEDDGSLPRIEDRPGFRVHRYLLTATSVIEHDVWMGRYIPVIPLIGEETRIGRKVIRHGVVRHLKDAQRRYNYFVSAETEIVALQPKAPWLGTVENFSEDDEWQYANSKNLPYLTYLPDSANGNIPPQRVSPPVSSQGLAEGIALASADMNRVTGKYAPSLGADSSEKSGVAIAARQRQGDTGTFVYIDNFSLAVTHTGRVVLDLMPHIYDAKRMISVQSEDGDQRQVEINVEVVDPEAENFKKIINDVTVGAYDVVMSLGPSYATKREEARDSMIEFGRTMPQQAQVFADLIAKAQDWPGADEIAKRIRRTIPPQILEDPEDQGPKPPPQPSQEAVDEMVKAQAEQQSMQTKQAERAAELQAKAEGIRIEQEAKRGAMLIEQEAKMFDLEAQRRKLLLDIEQKRATVLSTITTRNADAKDVTDQLAALDELTAAQARNSTPFADLDGGARQ